MSGDKVQQECRGNGIERHENAPGVERVAEGEEPAGELSPDRDLEPPQRRMAIAIWIGGDPVVEDGPGTRNVGAFVQLITRKIEQVDRMCGECRREHSDDRQGSQPGRDPRGRRGGRFAATEAADTRRERALESGESQGRFDPVDAPRERARSAGRRLGIGVHHQRVLPVRSLDPSRTVHRHQAAAGVANLGCRRDEKVRLKLLDTEAAG